jgi:hypothetical protein
LKVKELVKEAIKGIIDGILVIILYLYLLPYALGKIYEALGYSWALPTRSGTFILLTIIIAGLTITARLVKGTIFNPTLRSTANLFGILFVLYIMGNGVITVSGVDAGDFTADITFDMSPIVVVIMFFFAIPGVIIPFIDYFINIHKIQE